MAGDNQAVTAFPALILQGCQGDRGILKLNDGVDFEHPKDKNRDKVIVEVLDGLFSDEACLTLKVKNGRAAKVAQMVILRRESRGRLAISTPNPLQLVPPAGAALNFEPARSETSVSR